MGDDSEWMKLPVDQKCEHKVAAGALALRLWLSLDACWGVLVHAPPAEPTLGWPNRCTLIG